MELKCRVDILVVSGGTTVRKKAKEDNWVGGGGINIVDTCMKTKTVILLVQL